MRSIAWFGASLLLLVVAPKAAWAAEPEKPPEAGPAEAPLRELKLGLGTQKVVRVPGLTRVSVGDSSVLDVRPLGGGELVLVGVGTGATTLIVWMGPSAYVDYRVTVLKDYGAGDGPVGEIRKLLGALEGVTVRMVGERVFIDGFTYTAADTDRVAKIAACYPALVVNLVKPAPVSRTLLAGRITGELVKAGLVQARVVAIGDTYFLEGSVESEADKARAEKITRAVLAEASPGR